MTKICERFPPCFDFNGSLHFMVMTQAESLGVISSQSCSTEVFSLNMVNYDLWSPGLSTNSILHRNVNGICRKKLNVTLTKPHQPITIFQWPWFSEDTLSSFKNVAVGRIFLGEIKIQQGCIYLIKE